MHVKRDGQGGGERRGVGLTLDVAVQDLLGVAVGQALEELLHVALDLRHGELLAGIGEAGQVVLKEFHHHVNGALALVVVRT